MRRKNNMNQDHLIDWLTSNCPVFLSLLNQKAKTELPIGIKDYLSTGSDSEIEAGKINFLTIENLLSELIAFSSEKEVGDSYRRDISNVSTEQTLSEIFCEIALCVKVGSYSGSITLHPSTGKGTHSDCKFHIDGREIYGEVKRYQDSWPCIVKGEEENQKSPFGRSIFKSKPNEKSDGVARPRHMDIQSKLEDVHRQFPGDKHNILFVFLPSFGEPKDYLVQALLGQNNFKRGKNDIELENDGLFAKETWGIISACCLTRANPESKAVFPVVLKNPKAKMPIGYELIEKLENA